MIDIEPKRQDLKVLKISAMELANEKLGNTRVANMIILGTFVGLTGVVTAESVIGALEKVLPDYGHDLIPLNRQALEIGIELANEIYVI